MATVDTSDALIVVEEWISEHYFTTDAKGESFRARVTDLRKSWDAEDEHPTPRSRLQAQRQELLRRMVALATGKPGAEASDELNALLAETLGYHEPGIHRSTDGPLTLLRSAGLEEPVVALVSANQPGSLDELMAKDEPTLVTPYEPEGAEAVQSVSRLLSTLFVGAEPRPAFALVLAGRWVIVAERERWPEGRYLAIDLQLVLERADDRRAGETDRALACCAASSIVPDAQGDIWWEKTLAESARHTVGVSQDLREGVRLSIEIIANEVLRRRAAQGLPPLGKDEAQPLAREALRFLYRILFLLYAEASPELGVLPTGAPEYDRGYSLDRLRDLTLVEIADPREQQGTHLYESLAVLFRMVDQGHDPAGSGPTGSAEGLEFRPLRADLFAAAATTRIDEVGLGNAALQRVLRHLLLSKASASRDRGFISYAELGINQLGAVYEGLMSYTGFFAEDDLYEVAKSGDAEKGSWVVPTHRLDPLLEDHLVMTEDEFTGEPQPVIHERGTFVFRLSGRDRQQSASYYTPEVLTRFVVSQSLEELLDQGDEPTTASEMLELTICEPALGSGAFAIEAVRQLAEEYLRRRQDELGQRIDPEQFPAELQRAKAHFALHQTYGVDLNATAVELAEISLWLDTMVAGLDAPWFGLHLRRGNSLIGAQRAVYSRNQIARKAWLKAAPTAVGEETEQAPRLGGYVPHFLVPAEGWGAAADVGKEIKDLAPDAVSALKGWRKEVRSKPTAAQVERLMSLGYRVERLWALAQRRLEIAEQQVRRDVHVWGADAPASAAGRAVPREEIEASLADPGGAYRRLRRVMDAWCALWFWPLTETEARPPALEEWIDAIGKLLGHTDVKAAARGQESFGAETDWDELEQAERRDLEFAAARPVDEALREHPWLAVCERIAGAQGFFHWELDFAPVFAERGGFDLQVGNPPWVRPRSDVEGLLAEGNPWWAIATKPTQEVKKQRRDETLALSGMRALVVDATADQAVASEYLSWPGAFPHLAGLQPNLYRCFMEATWSRQSPQGVTGLIHPETHFTDDKAGVLRGATYRRLRRHWQFVNEFHLFEIHHLVWYGVHVYGSGRQQVAFRSAAMLYHPETVERSYRHDGSGPEPGLKDDDGNWDLRPHARRLLTVDEHILAAWHALVEAADTPVEQSRQVYTVSESVLEALVQLTGAPRIGGLDTEFSRGWDESIDRQKGRFDVDWGPATDWNDVILQGPHLYVANPFFKSPNATMAHQTDWSPVDLETLAPDSLPTTSYKPRGDRATYDAQYTHWGQHGELAARDYYRVAWRNMAANTGERTLIPAIIPPGSAHVHTVYSLAVPSSVPEFMAAAAAGATLMSDFLVRAVPKNGIHFDTYLQLPYIPVGSSIASHVRVRFARLECLTAAYSDLWAACDLPPTAAWTGGVEYPGRSTLGDITPEWTPESPLRRASDRRQALLEIDALVALSLGVTIDQLCTIYRTQFPVLYGYDTKRDHYDANGRLVPQPVIAAWKKRGDAVSEEERTHTNASGNTYVYELPFRLLDREADMRRAYAHFEELLADG